MTNVTLRSLLIPFLRVFVYLLLSASVAYASLYYVAELRQFHPEALDSLHLERSYLEFAQSIFVIFTITPLLWLGYKHKQFRPLNITLAMLLGCAAIREQDYFLETIFFNNAWQAVTCLMLLCYFLYIRNHFQELLNLIPRFKQSSSFGLFLGGFIIVIIFSRIIGSKAFWIPLMGDKYFKLVKSMAEENIELAGYTLLFIAMLEYWYNLRHWTKEKR